MALWSSGHICDFDILSLKMPYALSLLQVTGNLKQCNEKALMHRWQYLQHTGTTATAFMNKTLMVLLFTTHYSQSHERHGVSTHRQFNCLFHILFRVASKQTLKLSIIGLMPGLAVDFPHKGSITRKVFPLHSVTMTTEEIFCPVFCYSSVPFEYVIRGCLIQWSLREVTVIS